MPVSRFADHLLAADTTANRPAANAVPEGALFPSTDDLIVYQSDGVSNWDVWADFSATGGGSIDEQQVALLAQYFGA